MKSSFYNFYVSLDDQKTLIYNTISGAYILVDNVIEKHLKDNNFEAIKEKNTSILAELLNNGIALSDDSIDEYELVNNVRLQKRLSNKEYHLTINPTLNCNLACWYCYESHNPNSNMSFDILDRIKKHLVFQKESTNFKILSLNLFGGEPFLRKEICKEILMYSKKFCIENDVKLKISITTNGTLVTQDILDVLKDTFVVFQVTIDGNKNKHNKVRCFKATNEEGSYERILQNLRLITNTLSNYKLSLRINFDGKTLNGLSDILSDIDFLPRDTTELALHRVWQIERDSVDYRELYSFIQKANNNSFVVSYIPLGAILTHVCYADNWNQSVINFDGKVYKCTARDFKDENWVGVLNHDGTITWKTSEIRNRISLDTPIVCKNCKLFPTCIGMCSQRICENGPNIECTKFKSEEIEDIILLNFNQKLLLNKIKQ